MMVDVRNGWVIGRIGASPVRWNLRTGDVREVTGLVGYASAVNRYGWQVGVDAQGRAVFRPDAGPVVMPDLAVHKPGGLSNIPTTVSDDGKVIGGQSDDRSGVIHAVLWTCS
jgi:probable HAF family extracellular repeat protein